jgi:exodeoxyribonuclease V alpha subunit
LRQVDHAWAITIHKSQGSEFPNVVLIIDGSDDFISKELIYTGITRAKKGLILLSTFDIDYYETLKSSNNRATNLKELLSI